MKRALLLALVGSGLVTAVAWADKTIYAGFGNQYIGGNISMAQGEKVTFTNSDTVAHDVTAKTNGSDGKPLFKSALIGAGGSGPVDGAEYLTTGSYDYLCSVHPFMTGTITVTSEGMPVPRPTPSPSPSPTPGGGDTTAATVSAKLLDTKKSAVRKRRALQISVTVSEAVALKISAKSGSTVVASGSAKVSKASTKKVSVPLTKAGLKLVKKSGTIKIAVTVKATDGAGNKSSASASGRVR
jgi:plastocyanin